MLVNLAILTQRRTMLRKGLLMCGILSSLLYVAMNIFVPMQFEGYSYTSQTVSELSAIGAPTLGGYTARDELVSR